MTTWLLWMCIVPHSSQAFSSVPRQHVTATLRFREAPTMAKWQRRITPYLFISPFFIGYAIFFLYPVIRAVYLSFFQQIGIGSEPKFVGFQNYLDLFTDSTFLKALWNTTYYAAGSIFIISPLLWDWRLCSLFAASRAEFFRLLFLLAQYHCWRGGRHHLYPGL